MKKIVLLSLLLVTGSLLKAQVYGPYYGINLYGYKSNLFNSDDLRTDTFQSYKITPGFAGSLEYGYLWQNGFSLTTGLQFGTSNQNYKGSDPFLPYTMTANTKMSFIKIPLIFGKQKMNDRKTKLLYTVGFFYSYNTGYSDKIVIDFIDPNTKDLQTTIKKEVETNTVIGDTFKSVYTMDKRPYARHGLGALASLGMIYKLKDKMELIAQVKGEFTITNAENTAEAKYTPVKPTPGLPEMDYTYGNYAKYMNVSKLNYNRAATHPFNIGISVGLRMYLFDFD
ncbi:MAG TPA: hypothetical protein PLU10_07380 [Chitinophagaceae bacterium]|nr:hypothetical protein [Chitinophagaceae bacterium]